MGKGLSLQTFLSQEAVWLCEVKTNFAPQLEAGGLRQLWALESAGPGDGKRRKLELAPQRLLVTSRKLGLPLGGEKRRARPPCPSLLAALGFAQALQSTELTVNAVTSGNSHRGRGKDQDSGAPVPVLAYCPAPPSVPPDSFRPPFSKGAMPSW